MELAFSIGINISDFWDMTPYELIIAQRGFIMVKNREAEEFSAKFKLLQELAISQAWCTANWSRAKKIPNLDKVLGADKKGNKKNKKMTDQEMLAQIRAINKSLGGEVK